MEVLIKQGKLKNFIGQERKDERLPQKGKVEELVCPPLGEIRVIVRGISATSSSRSKNTYLWVVPYVQLTSHPPRVPRMDEPAITFTDEDVRRLHHPYDNAIVITLTIANYTTRRVLIDNESSADILYYPAFQQMKINKELFCPTNVPLIEFGGMKVLPVGTISLPIMVGSYPQQITKEVNLLIVDCSSSYNFIIGRLTLNSWRTVTSTYHLSFNFPTDYGIGEV